MLALLDMRPGSLLFCKYALGPLLKFQGIQVRRTIPQLAEPEGARNGVAGLAGAIPGPRLLIVGDSSAAGVGVQQQEFGLAAQVASCLAASMRSQVRWQLVAKTGKTAHTMRRMVMDAQLEPADVIICCVGANDVLRQTGTRLFLASYRQFVQEISARAGTRLVIINGLPPMHVLPAAPQPLRWYLGQYAHKLDAALSRWTASEPAMEYISLQWAASSANLAIDGFHPGHDQYREWARIIADRIQLRSQVRPA